MGLFSEPHANTFAHSPSSLVFAQDAKLQAAVGFHLTDIFPAAARTLDALTTYPEADSSLRTGFTLANDTVDKEPIFATIAKDAVRAKRVAMAMASFNGSEGYEMRHLVDHVDLRGADASGGTFVDMGGSHGFVCVEMAKRWRGMKFVVQDLAGSIATAPKHVTEDRQVLERITFMAHDFFTEQVVKNADGIPPFSRSPSLVTRFLTGGKKSTSSASYSTTTPTPTPSTSSGPSSRP